MVASFRISAVPSGCDRYDLIGLLKHDAFIMLKIFVFFFTELSWSESSIVMWMAFTAMNLIGMGNCYSFRLLAVSLSFDANYYSIYQNNMLQNTDIFYNNYDCLCYITCIIPILSTIDPSHKSNNALEKISHNAPFWNRNVHSLKCALCDMGPVHYDICAISLLSAVEVYHWTIIEAQIGWWKQ